MKLLIFTFAIVVAVSAQYDSPVPPRPVIPGAAPAPVQRVSLRRRQQFSKQDEAPAVPQRRLGGRGGPRRLPPPLLDQPVQRPRPAVYQEPYPTRPPTPSPTIPPRPVIEDEDDDDEETIASTVPPTLPPQTYRPIPVDFPPPTRQQYLRPAPPQISIDDDSVDVQYVRQPRPQPVQTQVQFRPQPVQNPIRSQPVQNSYQRPQPVQNSIQEQRNQPERQRPAQQFNRQQQVSRPVQKQVAHSKDEPNPNRPRKPVSQILKKYRDEAEDGTITWGFENDDGTFKEETIGTDCVTRGKYGYIDPDGVRREYSYSSGIPCDKPDSESEASNSEGYIDYTNNKYVFPNGDTIDLDNMVRNRARKPVYKN